MGAAVKISAHAREMAARFCCARASAEAAGILLDLNWRPTGRRDRAYHVFDGHVWTKAEGQLAHAAFMSVIHDGANPRAMAENWGEAEARLRQGEYP
jgi:hypothetical protein